MFDTSNCIYQIVHRETNTKYVGQTTKKLGKRWGDHCRLDNSCLRLKNAIQKYGKDAFDISVLEVCETIEQLNEREEHWIKELNTLSPNGYNLRHGGNNKLWSEEVKAKMSEGQKRRPPPSEETRLKMSKSASKPRNPPSEETRRKIAEGQKNRHPITDATRKLMSESNKGKGRFGRVISDETRLKMSASARNYWNSKNRNDDDKKETIELMRHLSREYWRKRKLNDSSFN